MWLNKERNLHLRVIKQHHKKLAVDNNYQGWCGFSQPNDTKSA